jgi:hypothetical protein
MLPPLRGYGATGARWNPVLIWLRNIEVLRTAA